MAKQEWIKKVMIIGSGAIKIGEAGEFDYSGAQSIKALKEEGIKTVLVNPNIATIQTDKKFADEVYLLPITKRFLEKVIKKERPNGILLGFGGQTALNVGMELAEEGVLERYGVKVLGTQTEAIEIADNRRLFKETLEKDGVPVPKAGAAHSIDEAVKIAKGIGYPVMIRVAYTLGGKGTGVAHNENELRQIARRGLAHSRISQVLVEEYVGKWKEVEYEVMRDADDNCTIVCNMENFDPMGVHTGESIVIAPSQTLTNREYHKLRTACFKIVRILGIVGECNIQFALNPQTEEYKVIELNSRLSRSSALASKATGYPIAYIATKLAIGYTLPELMNKVTGVTTACFEPALDYCVVKIPRWDFQKFKNVSRRLGSQMKSVGEVMAVGRRFEEALQKAVRMLNIGRELTDETGTQNGREKILDAIEKPTDLRLYNIIKALKTGVGIEEIHELSGIDRWFLNGLKNIVEIEGRLESEDARELGAALLRESKELGFSDRKIAQLRNTSEAEIRRLRKSYHIIPAVKQIDTLAAEWPAVTNYLYLTYNGEEDDIEFPKKRNVIVIGSGTYRIGSSVEFDWCCVNMAWALKERGMDEVIMVNCNPETVSTDFDVLDKLYFEELTFERVMDIIEKENPAGVVVSVGGQIPNNLAMPLKQAGVKILGTAAENIDRAENRSKFSSILDELGIAQPRWSALVDIDQAKEFAEDIGYPVLIRPSYVLSGSAMKVAEDENQLERYLQAAAMVSKEYPVVISKFITQAKEVEIDGICDGRNVFIGAVIEHVENAGVHSGDATMSIPTLTLEESVKNKLRDAARRIAIALEIRGPFNVQFLVKDGHIYVIECNLRSSRSMPFVSKTVGINMMQLAADAILGKEVPDGEKVPVRYGVKSPQFSFMRLEGADPVTDVEMVSTGEVACFGATFPEAFLKSLLASGFKLPEPGERILISCSSDKSIIPVMRNFINNGFEVLITEHTRPILENERLPIKVLGADDELTDGATTGGNGKSVIDYLSNKEVGMVTNIPSNSRTESDIDFAIRRKAAEFGIPIITNLELAKTLANIFEDRDRILDSEV